MNSVVAAHPTLARKITLRETLFEGQKQYAVHITKDVGVPNDRPSIIIDAQHHAREVMTPEIAKDMIDYLTSRYATDVQVQRWVDNINIYVVPSVNPDGGNVHLHVGPHVAKEPPSRRVRGGQQPELPARLERLQRLERNVQQRDYRGTAPASEPETQGLIQLTADTRPFFALSYHSYGEYILYAYGCGNSDEHATLDEVAQGLNSILEDDNGVTGKYATGATWSTIYLVDGGSSETQYAVYGANAFTVEVNNSAAGGFQPDYATWRDVTVQRQRTSWSYFLDKTLDGAQIRGTVTDAITGLPLAATVNLQEVTFTHGEAPRTADAKGNYRRLVHSNGTYHLSYSFPGHCTATREVAVGTGPAEVDVVLGQPDIPTGVATAPGGDYAIDVSWQPAVNADEYRVLRSLNSGGPYTDVGTVPATQTTLSRLPGLGRRHLLLRRPLDPGMRLRRTRRRRPARRPATASSVPRSPGPRPRPTPLRRRAR